MGVKLAQISLSNVQYQIQLWGCPDVLGNHKASLICLFSEMLVDGSLGIGNITVLQKLSLSSERRDYTWVSDCSSCSFRSLPCLWGTGPASLTPSLLWSPLW